MKVLKFGGTSVANAENIKRVKNISAAYAKESQLVIVVSALGGVTDLLIEALETASQQNTDYEKIYERIKTRHLETINILLNGEEEKEAIQHILSEFEILKTLLDGAFLIGEITPKLSDKVLSYGELLSSYIINSYFNYEKLDAIRKDSRLLIKTDSNFGQAAVDFNVTNVLCANYFETVSYQIIVVPGFVAKSLEGDSTTLGRGGSDYTAAIIAGAIEKSSLEIWTDVSGMYTANPKLVKHAFAIPEISYEEAMELSHFGAKVLYPPTVQPVFSKGIPIRIKNTFKPEAAGTLISKMTNENEKPVRGISHIDHITLLTLEGSGMIGIPGISKRFFEVLSLEQISVVMITQASSEHSICIGVANKDADKAKKLVDKAFEYEISGKRIKPCIVEKGLSIIALVGDHMKSHQGLSGKMFSALGANNVNIRAIAQGASERNISAVIKQEDVSKALNTLHERFFEDNIKQLNLFIMGVGNVGSKFLGQIAAQHKYVKKTLKLNIKVIGISNSRTMIFKENGVDLKTWEEALKNGEKANPDLFLKKVLAKNLHNSIFVDNTASNTIAATYEGYLRNSIAVVTCNKIACASEYQNYLKLKALSTKYGAPFLFETNVGAGLPIIDTLKNLVASGDKIIKIQAVLSGSLNFIFNNYDGQTSFEQVVKQAGEEGYTEPDPKIDLSGIDVMRKILILARESGYQLEIDDIKNNNFLPEESLKTTTVETFLESLSSHEKHFKKIYESAAKQEKCLKYVAQFENGEAHVGIQEVAKEHPFYNLAGKDNIVLFFTDRYKDQPLLIKGAGAGAEVTASGIFADIIRVGNFQIG
ncbi:bifunctional aspartate kinase/homoserine dehydrogenase I [Ascidiimonas sp. W6]|uniref:bifunctional aspartate kinase/homoserine dehydrogenase I n=1 Tax=Ascidiimonas meishanensis TaxID=3128903 RepID=UPI0030EB6029